MIFALYIDIKPNIMKKFIALILSLLAVTIAFTQAQVLPIDQLLVNDFKQNSTPDQNKLMPGHFTIGKDLALTADQFIDGYKPVLTPAKESDLKKIITHQSKGGRTHHRYQQTWNGIPVEGQYVLLHEQNGILNSINGAVVAGLSINVHPALSETQALANVRQPSTRYAWEDATMETELQQVTGNPDATYFPKGKLVIFSGDQPPSSNSNYKLAWRFNLYSLTPHDHQQFYVDAQTGVILKTTSLMKHTYVQGSGATNYNGNQTITCNHKHHHYELNSPDIETRKYAGSYNGTGNPFLSLNTTWTGNSAALDVHWGTEKFVEFLNVELGRNGYDGNGKKIRAMVGYPFQNAFWNGYYLGYGVGNNNTLASPTSLDIVGHEYTHAMLDEIVGFQYGGESGAIEEAYSDIFGELIEHFVKGSADWKVGAEITQTAGVPNNLGLRNLMNPNSYNAPSVYKGQHWHNGPSDNWGVHTNSSVYSHWFYLVAFGNGSTINGIGISAATELIYETLFYLQPYSDYYDLRNASAATASSLPQFTPAMLADVDAAWNEVGLGAVSAIEITGIIPAAGATVYGDSTTLIEWDTNLSLSLVDIQYSLNGGVSWLDIVLNHSYNSGQYLWPVSQIYSNTVLVRVMGSVNPTIRGTSNGYFKIKASINFPPVAIDDVLHTKQGYSEYLKVWDNDMDEKELDTMSVSIVNDMSANEGTTYVHPNGTIEITAEASFVGVSSFQYRVCDHGIPVLCDTATVTVNIGEVPRKQLAMHDWGILNLNDTLSENLLENDYLLDPSWTMVGWHPVALTHGNITIDQTTGDYVYLPSSLGRDTICYVVTNGLINDTAYLNLFVVEDKPGAKDSMDLVILYEMTDGPNWVYKWNLTSPVVFWYGISTNFASRVTSINLSSNGLNGQLHNFSSLDQLDYLDLNDNRLCGQIPDFPNFENVSRLDLQYNQFTGQLPDFSSLIDATWIYLSHNRIEGPLPDFSNLNKVSWLYIDNNHLSGPLTNMTYLDSWLIIHNNQLTFDGIYENYINYNVTLDCNPQAPIPITRLSESLRVYAGGDTTLNTYYWHNHTTNTTHTVQGTNYFTPPNQGEYSCKIENDGIITWILTLNSDTVYYEPSCNISPASHSFVTPCIGDSIEARYLEMQSYSWSFNGTVVGTTPKLAVYESGTYVVSFQDSCMNPMIYDTIHVTIDSTCIQPGDTNQDGIVNHHDLLNIGLHYGTIGPARNGDPEDFFPIKGIDWAQQTNSGLDLKHVDANGDGIINSSDTTIIALHYGKQWSVYTPSVDSAISPIRIVPEIVAAPQGVSGDFTIQYVLENHLNNTINLYGLALKPTSRHPLQWMTKFG